MAIRKYNDLPQEASFYFGVDDYEQKKHMRKFSEVLWSYADEIQYLTEDVLKIAIDDKIIRYTTQTQQYEDTLKSILCNAISSVMTSRFHVTISMNKDSYTGIPDRYNPIGIKSRVFINLIKWLSENDYLNLYIAPRGSKVKVRSVFIVTDKLRELINGYEVKQQDLVHHKGTEPIELKRAKKLADYDDNESTHETRGLLQQYEELLNSYKTKITINGERQTQRVRIVRKCSEQLTKHGRIYGGSWQNCKSSNRETIIINNEETVEIDIVNCSLRMALHLKKINVEGDLYEGIKDYPRRLVKDSLNMMLNLNEVKSTKQGLARVAQAMKEKYKDNDLSYLRELVEACFNHYEYISKEYFFQGRGLDLQYLDSKICLKVIEDFTNDNEVVLTVHDSFIVRKELELKLRQSIISHYEEIIGEKPILR